MGSTTGTTTALTVGTRLERLDFDHSVTRLEIVKRGPKETTIGLVDYPGQRGTAWLNAQLDEQIEIGQIWHAGDAAALRARRQAEIDRLQQMIDRGAHHPTSIARFGEEITALRSDMAMAELAQQDAAAREADELANAILPCGCDSGSCSCDGETPAAAPAREITALELRTAAIAAAGSEFDRGWRGYVRACVAAFRSVGLIVTDETWDSVDGEL